MSQHHDTTYTHDDARDDDVRAWFQALGPPPRGQAPSDLRAHVQAQIAPRRRRRWCRELATLLRMRVKSFF